MLRYAALAICFSFILWLFARDRKLRPMTSGALWVPLLWIVLIGSKPSAYWFGAEIDMGVTDSYVEGSPFDRNLYLLLIVTGAWALFRRRIDWRRVFQSNVWLVAFFGYCGLSILWSDFPFVSFKRWIKDLGNIVMVLIILTETDPVQAIRAVFARYIYFAVPVSVLLIGFFPELGTNVDRWSQEASYIAITTNKNELGIILVICGLLLIWDLLEIRLGSLKTDKMDLFLRAALMAMLIWLVIMAHSATAVVCLSLGTGLLLFTQFPTVRRQFRYIGTYSLGIGILFLLLYLFPGMAEFLVSLLGRDLTLTGRTEIWAGLLGENVNPLIGSGYMSFWLGPALERYDYIIQAHNGYLDTYLNGGLIGIGLLLALILFTGSKVKQELLQGGSVGILLFLFLVISLFYNCTEAMFNRLSLIWFVLLLAASICPQSAPQEATHPALQRTANGVNGKWN